VDGDHRRRHDRFDTRQRPALVRQAAQDEVAVGDDAHDPVVFAHHHDASDFVELHHPRDLRERGVQLAGDRRRVHTR
jgi:hypothetical protein